MVERKLIRWDDMTVAQRRGFLSRLGLDEGFDLAGLLAKGNELVRRQGKADHLARALVHCFEQGNRGAGKDAGADREFVTRLDDNIVHVGPAFRLRLGSVTVGGDMPSAEARHG